MAPLLYLLRLVFTIIVFVPSQTVSAFEMNSQATAHVEWFQEKFVLKQGQWYSDGLDWTFINNFYDDLLERIQNACDRANIECNLR